MNPQNVYKKIFINARYNAPHPHFQGVITDKAAGSRPCPRRSGGPRGRGRSSGRGRGRAPKLQQEASNFQLCSQNRIKNSDFCCCQNHFIRLQHSGGRMFTGTEVKLLSIIYFLHLGSISAEFTNLVLSFVCLPSLDLGFKRQTLQKHK